MKKNVFLILFMLLPVLGFAQGNCHLVDEICQKARQFANSGDTETALKGLRRAQNDNELRSCPGFYKIADLFNEIEKSKLFQEKCEKVDEVCRRAQQFADSGDTEMALNGLRRAQNDIELRSCPGFYKFAELIKEIEGRNNNVSDVVEQMPSFPGGQDALMQYLGVNIKYPKTAVKKGIQGRVIVQFVVEKDGSLTDVRVIEKVAPSLDSEAERVVKSMPNWIPGKQNGSPVRVKYTVPITFKL